MSAGAACKLRIVRGSGYADWLRNYKIRVNGGEVGIIARNSVLNVEVPCGTITVEARLDWGRSQPLTIEATPGQRIEIEVSNHWGALLALWGSTFGYRDYLLLKHVT
jgi:hypothetical protein